MKKRICNEKTMTKNILIVDDEEAVCQMLKKFFTKVGYKASYILSCEDAINRVKRERFLAVFLDIRMPQMNGVEALRKIKEIDKDVNVVMITAIDEEGVAKKCIELGAYDYITKPLSLEYLENVLTAKLLGFEKKPADLKG